MPPKAAAVSWSALGALIAFLLSAGVVVWQGGALSGVPSANATAVVDHEARIRTLEEDRAGIAEMRTDVGWIRAAMAAEHGAD